MKKWNIQVFFIGTAFCSLQAFATLEHINGKNFVENGLNISYPCTAGGEPLVIYSTEVHNKKPISSKNKIVPVYTKTGFIGTPIEITYTQQFPLISTIIFHHKRQMIQRPTMVLAFGYAEVKTLNKTLLQI